jgi:glycosyltransferase involved in cell wall biosynthesis
MGHEVEVFGWLHTNRYLADSLASLTQMRYIEKFPRFTRRLAHHAGDLFANQALRRWQPDIIHESYCHSRRVGSKSTPRVCTIHDMMHELFPIHRLYPQYRGKMDHTPEYRRKTLARSDAVICVSESTKQDLLRLTDVDPAKVSVVHHGFDHISGSQKLLPSEAKLLQELGPRPFLLYVGTRHGWKNFEGFIRAFVSSGLHEDMSVIAFGGTAFTPQELEAHARIGLDARHIRQVGGTDSLLCALFRVARAFVYPSLYEGFGFPPLEAMAHGCPVISSNTSSMPEVIGDAAEFFDPDDIDDIASSIRSVVDSEKRQAELVAKGYSRLGNFSWKKCANETQAVYRNVVG